MGITRKSPEQLRSQVEEAGFAAEKGDFELTEKELEKKYGKIYQDYVAALRKLKNTLTQKPEIINEIPDEDGKKNRGMTRRDFMKACVSGAATLATCAGGCEVLGRRAHEAKMTVGKNNPILAAQTREAMVFKADFGDQTTNTGSVEQVILYPSIQDGEIEREKEEIQKLFQEKRIDAKEFQKRMSMAESRKEQGFISTERKEIVTFNELAEEIREKGQQGIMTTLNFGDSSTSGWNSDILTENAINTVGLLYEEIRHFYPELPDTFEGFCLQHDPIAYRSRDIVRARASAAEKLKSLPEFNQIVAKNWSKVREHVKSPFLTYDTYSDKAAKIDPRSHAVNLGVPGYSSVHLKSYVKRMLQKFETAGVLRYIDSTAIYIGNNDCVYNGNSEDKYYLGEDTDFQLHGLGFLKETFPKIFYTPRVSQADYRDNLDEMVGLLESYKIKNIVLIVPVVPLDWQPGLRAINDAQNVVDALYAQQGRASSLYDAAKDKYVDYIYEASMRRDGTEIAQLGQVALESDPMVPRIKSIYVQAISEVAAKHQVGLVNLNPVLPARDMSHMNTLANNWQNIAVDYCHPSEHSNILIAYAQCLAKNPKESQTIKTLAKQELVKLGLSEVFADDELSAVEKTCVVKKSEPADNYRRLASTARNKKDWDEKADET